MRAPPESLMPMTGQPTFIARSMILHDLLAEDFAEAAAEHGEVLGEHAHLAPVDRAVTGDHAVAVRTVGCLVESDRAMPREAVEFDERAGVEQRVDALARGSFALRVLAFDRSPPIRRARPRRRGRAGRRACPRWCAGRSRRRSFGSPRLPE